MDLSITPADRRHLPIVQNLARFYIYDMSEFMGWRCPESGLFGGCDEFFEDWQRNVNHPFVIRARGELAGFAGVKAMQVDNVAGHCIQEFFMLRKFRRQGLGKRAAEDIFSRFPGAWHIEQLAMNAPAQAFWRAVVSAYTHGAFTCGDTMHPVWGPMTHVRFTSRAEPPKRADGC